jgi:hypothetical protein
MVKFITFENVIKKEQKKLNAEKRRDWNGLTPVTRVVPDSKKVYKRKPKHPEDYE